MLTLLAKLLKALNSNDNPAQIALAIVFALFLGITPLWSVYNLLWLFLLLVVRVNLSMFFVAWGLFTLIAYMIDPLSHQLGLTLLHSDALNAMWTAMYNNDFWRFVGFNNTLILGGFVLCAITAVPVFLLSVYLINRYRRHGLAWVKRTRLSTWLRSSRLISIYQSLSD